MAITIKALNVGDQFHYDLYPKHQEKVNTTLVGIISIDGKKLSVKIIGPIMGAIGGFAIGQELSFGISDRCYVTSPKGFCFRFSETDTLNPKDRRY
jgi:hypothetical protein